MPPRTAVDYLTFTQLIESLKQNGLSDIWDQIEQRIAGRMIDEFGCLYNNDDRHPEFMALIENGQYAHLKHSQPYQLEAEKSKGYNKYCTKTMHFPRFFTAKELLISQRHNNLEAQHAYDKQFGLIPQIPHFSNR